jgi:hypothetical protein
VKKGFTFASWLAVQHYCETHAWIYYHAPMDYSPCVVAVRKVYKNGKIRIDYHGNRFTIDAGHLDRCSYPD